MLKLDLFQNIKLKIIYFYGKGIIDAYKLKKTHVFAWFIDPRKIFDMIRGKGLVYKILCYGESNKFCSIIQSMYSQLTACVKFKYKWSKKFISSIGNRQVCPLSPVLFNLFLMDLQQILDQDKLFKLFFLTLSMALAHKCAF